MSSKGKIEEDCGPMGGGAPIGRITDRYQVDDEVLCRVKAEEISKKENDKIRSEWLIDFVRKISSEPEFDPYYWELMGKMLAEDPGWFISKEPKSDAYYRLIRVINHCGKDFIITSWLVEMMLIYARPDVARLFIGDVIRNFRHKALSEETVSVFLGVILGCLRLGKNLLDIANRSYVPREIITKNKAILVNIFRLIMDWPLEKCPVAMLGSVENQDGRQAKILNRFKNEVGLAIRDNIYFFIIKDNDYDLAMDILRGMRKNMDVLIGNSIQSVICESFSHKFFNLVMDNSKDAMQILDLAINYLQGEYKEVK